VLAP